MTADLEGPIVVVSPHLDDAVLSAWSLLRLPATVDVRVVVVFAGIPSEGTIGTFDPIFGTSDSAGLVRQRRAEDLAALAAAGRSPVHLDLLDVQYRAEPLAERTVVDALRDHVAGAVTIAAPAGIGRHPDHLLARDAAAALAGSTGAHLIRFADLPYAANMGWPSWVTGAPADPHLVPDALWGSLLDEVGGPRTVQVEGLDEDERRAKLEALRCYRSQFPALDGGPIGRLTNPMVSAFEVRWLT